MPEKKLYLERLPPGVNYPDDDPYILQLKEKCPGTLWDRYLPAEVVVERLKRFRNRWAKREEEVEIPELLPGTWGYNATWESVAWDEQIVGRCEGKIGSQASFGFG